MISSKTVEITKYNRFEKGWSLFRPYSLGIERGGLKTTSASEIVKKITKADSITLVLSEICLARMIVEEIAWVSKYVSVSIVASTQAIIDSYKQIQFHNIEVQPTVNYNLLKIDGANSSHFFISTEYYEVNQIYDSPEACLENADSIIAINELAQYSKIFSIAEEKHVKCYVAYNVSKYSIDDYNAAITAGVGVLVCNHTNNGMVVTQKDGRVTFVMQTSNRLWISIYIGTVETILGLCFIHAGYANSSETKDLSRELFCCENGTIKRIRLLEGKVVDVPVYIEDMEDYIEQRFDSSITAQHNDYMLYNKVVYRFELYPPQIDDRYKESHIYDGTHALLAEWIKYQTLDIDKIIQDYYAITPEDFGVVAFVKYAAEFDKSLRSSIEDFAFKGYHSWLFNGQKLYEQIDTNLLMILKSTFQSIDMQGADDRFTAIDNEIAGYQATIREKEALIKAGKDVLSNQRRIEILKEKISNLQSLKQHFLKTSSGTKEKNANAFLTYCRKVLTGEISTNDDSIASIIQQDNTSIEQLKIFVLNYLCKLDKYVSECLPVLQALREESFPEDYLVYEKDAQRYIVIESVEEFAATSSIRNQYGLKCVTSGGQR